MNKVLLISIDGMRPDGVKQCDDGSFVDFFMQGAYSFNAQTVFPPVTLPAHMSMFHSVDPDRHGIYNNIYVQQNHPIAGLVETIKAAGKTSAFFYTWEKLRDLCEPGTLEYGWFRAQHSTLLFPQLEQQATKQAIECIKANKPDFAFLYLGGTDEFGHQDGWMSQRYLNEIAEAAKCVYDICARLPEEYSVIVTADHGGHNRNHGDQVPEDMTIPMTIHSPLITTNKILENASIKDIPPTVTKILGIKPSTDWEGHSLI